MQYIDHQLLRGQARRANRRAQLGCGTALPSLAVFQWASAARATGSSMPLTLTLADYNPTVLYLVTLPNFLLAWALQQRERSPLIQEAFTSDDELELTPDVVEAFRSFLVSNQITLSFLSGAWSPEFVDLLYAADSPPATPGSSQTVVMGAETIYSPLPSLASPRLCSPFSSESGENCRVATLPPSSGPNGFTLASGVPWTTSLTRSGASARMLPLCGRRLRECGVASSNALCLN